MSRQQLIKRLSQTPPKNPAYMKRIHDGAAPSAPGNTSYIPNYTHHPRVPFKKPIPNTQPIQGMNGRLT